MIRNIRGTIFAVSAGTGHVAQGPTAQIRHFATAASGAVFAYLASNGRARCVPDRMGNYRDSRSLRARGKQNRRSATQQVVDPPWLRLPKLIVQAEEMGDRREGREVQASRLGSDPGIRAEPLQAKTSWEPQAAKPLTVHAPATGSAPIYRVKAPGRKVLGRWRGTSPR